MDDLTRQIAGFAAELKYDQLPQSVVTAASRFIVDTLACAIAAYDCESAQIGLRLARGAAPERYPGRMLLHGERSSAESAAFVNTAMIRNLDFNDEYPGGHPSDCLGAFLAIAEAANADGHRLIESLIIAYELFIRLSDATGLRYKGWDQGFAVGIGTAAGEGMTGAHKPFEGKHGLWDLITGPFELQPLPTEGGPYRVPETRLKHWPVEYNGQLPVWAALELRSLVDWRDLKEIEIGVYTFCYTEIGSEPEKWDPKTRETADHSLPYIFATVLVDGTMTLAALEESAYRDPALRPLMNKIRIYPDKDVDAIYPKTISMKVKATKTNGSVMNLWPRDPLGHANKPMTDDDVKKKFTQTVEPVYGKSKTAEVLERWWNIRETSASGVTEALTLLDLKS